MSISKTLQAGPINFQSLITAHRGIILKIAASYYRNADDRADLAQEIALQLWRAWPSYERSRPFSTWMYRVALNVAISQQRRDRQQERHEPLAVEHEDLIGARDVEVDRHEQLAIVQSAMQELVAFDRALLLLHLEGCSLRESGEVLGITQGNVATRLSRIKQQLRRIAGTTSTAGANDHGNG